MRVKFKLAQLRESRPSEWILRFVFGGLISVMASLVAKQFGPEIGGIALAFPSILPATLTFVVHHRSRAIAAEDARGACFGAVGGAAFALLIAGTIENWGSSLSVFAATALWFIVSECILLIFTFVGKEVKNAPW